MSFQLFCEELEDRSDLRELRIVDSSPGRLKDSRTPRISSANARQAMRIIVEFARKLRGTDRVLVFGGERFLLTIGALLLWASKLARKPCYFRVFGGSLDIYDRNLSGVLRWWFRTILRKADGLIVQTQLLRDFLTQVNGGDVFLVPGYRPLPPIETVPPETDRSGVEAAVVFVGHVREEKGVLVLLEAVRRLRHEHDVSVRCEIFGPVYESFEDRFRREIAQTEGASYGGVLDPSEVIGVLRRYDALVFPTYYEGEGHPGVIIESMMAGVPVVTTAFRSIPELVDDGVNGLMVAPQSVEELAQAIRAIVEDPPRAAEMGRQNAERRTRYDARRLAPLIAAPLGVGATGEQAGTEE